MKRQNTISNWKEPVQKRSSAYYGHVDTNKYNKIPKVSLIASPTLKAFDFDEKTKKLSYINRRA